MKIHIFLIVLVFVKDLVLNIKSEVVRHVLSFVVALFFAVNILLKLSFLIFFKLKI